MGPPVSGASRTKSIREEINKVVDIIFASSPAQRDFRHGQGKVPATDIQARFGGLKPCLHGSDAHKNDDVGPMTLFSTTRARSTTEC